MRLQALRLREKLERMYGGKGTTDDGKENVVGSRDGRREKKISGVNLWSTYPVIRNVSLA